MGDLFAMQEPSELRKERIRLAKTTQTRVKPDKRKQVEKPDWQEVLSRIKNAED
jgi:hypothetical protein